VTDEQVVPDLVVTRRFSVLPDEMFDAWTNPEKLREWWGPPGVKCTHAEVNLRVGGNFRLANLLPDGNTLWIGGTYEEVDAPRRLKYSWHIEPAHDLDAERVTVDFFAREGGTEVVVTHTAIDSVERFNAHQHGWVGCLDELADLFG